MSIPHTMLSRAPSPIMPDELDTPDDYNKWEEHSAENQELLTSESLNSSSSSASKTPDLQTPRGYYKYSDSVMYTPPPEQQFSFKSASPVSSRSSPRHHLDSPAKKASQPEEISEDQLLLTSEPLNSSSVGQGNTMRHRNRLESQWQSDVVEPEYNNAWLNDCFLYLIDSLNACKELLLSSPHLKQCIPNCPINHKLLLAIELLSANQNSIQAGSGEKLKELFVEILLTAAKEKERIETWVREPFLLPHERIAKIVGRAYWRCPVPGVRQSFIEPRDQLVYELPDACWKYIMGEPLPDPIHILVEEDPDVSRLSNPCHTFLKGMILQLFLGASAAGLYWNYRNYLEIKVLTKECRGHHDAHEVLECYEERASDISNYAFGALAVAGLAFRSLTFRPICICGWSYRGFIPLKPHFMERLVNIIERTGIALAIDYFIMWMLRGLWFNEETYSDWMRYSLLNQIATGLISIRMGMALHDRGIEASSYKMENLEILNGTVRRFCQRETAVIRFSSIPLRSEGYPLPQPRLYGGFERVASFWMKAYLTKKHICSRSYESIRSYCHTENRMHRYSAFWHTEGYLSKVARSNIPWICIATLVLANIPIFPPLIRDGITITSANILTTKLLLILHAKEKWYYNILERITKVAYLALPPFAFAFFGSSPEKALASLPIALVGVALGAKNFFYEEPHYINAEKQHQWKWWKRPLYCGISAAAFSLILSFIQNAVSCAQNDPEHCPLIFGLEAQMVTMDSYGLNIAVITGFVTYWLRQISKWSDFKCVSKWPGPGPKWHRYARRFHQLMDQFHLETICAAAYTLFKTSSKQESFNNVHYVHNSIPILASIGAATGTALDHCFWSRHLENHEAIQSGAAISGDKIVEARSSYSCTIL